MEEETNRSDISGTGDAAGSASEQRGTEEVDESAKHGKVVTQVGQAGESVQLDRSALSEDRVQSACTHLPTLPHVSLQPAMFGDAAATTARERGSAQDGNRTSA